MRSAKRVVMVFCLGLAFSAAAWAQGMMGRGPQPPAMPGIFKPAPGSGAQYAMDAKGHKMTFAYVSLGKETVEGQEGNWLEIRSEGAELQGEMVMKQLIVVANGTADIKRMIMQPPGRPPMEMPMGMMSGMMKQAQKQAGSQPQGAAAMGEKLGTESVTVPAGTFLCEHYRKQEQNGPVDLWISTTVAPYGLVKMTGPDTSMVLEKVLSNESSHIKGEPQKMKMPEMPHF